MFTGAPKAISHPLNEQRPKIHRQSTIRKAAVLVSFESEALTDRVAVTGWLQIDNRSHVLSQRSTLSAQSAVFDF